MVQWTHLVRVDIERPVCLSATNSVVLPAIPQTLDDIDEFVGARVAQLVVEVLVAAEILRDLGLAVVTTFRPRAPG